jgi:hypothetical protein
MVWSYLPYIIQVQYGLVLYDMAHLFLDQKQCCFHSPIPGPFWYIDAVSNITLEKLSEREREGYGLYE